MELHTFGMEMPGRKKASEEYRFGFNGKEKDTEITNTESHLDFGARIYDARIGRFLSLDPYYMNNSSVTPYSFAGNKPVFCIDYNGLYEVVCNGTTTYDNPDEYGYYQKVEITNEMIEVFTAAVNGVLNIDNAYGMRISGAIEYQTSLSQATVRSNMIPGQGEKIKIVDDSYMNGAARGNSGDGVEIAAGVVYQLYQAYTSYIQNPSSETLLEYQACAFAVAIIAGIHEPTHKYDADNNGGMITAALENKEHFDGLIEITSFGNQGTESIFKHRPLDVESVIFGGEQRTKKYSPKGFSEQVNVTGERGKWNRHRIGYTKLKEWIRDNQSNDQIKSSTNGVMKTKK